MFDLLWGALKTKIAVVKIFDEKISPPLPTKKVQILAVVWNSRMCCTNRWYSNCLIRGSAVEFYQYHKQSLKIKQILYSKLNYLG
jgi:hypothetical protein